MSTDNLMKLLQLKSDKETKQLQQEYVAMRDFIKQFKFVRQTASGGGTGSYVGEFHTVKYINNMELAYVNYLDDLQQMDTN